MSVERFILWSEYDPIGDVMKTSFISDPKGGWVRATDYDALAAENAELARCLDGGVNCAQERIEAKARIAALGAALRDLMPCLSECDCIYSDRLDPPCPCRAARAIINYEALETEAHRP